MLFLERDLPRFAANRDLPDPPYGRAELYRDVADLKRRFRTAIRRAGEAIFLSTFVLITQNRMAQLAHG